MDGYNASITRGAGVPPLLNSPVPLFAGCPPYPYSANATRTNPIRLSAVEGCKSVKVSLYLLLK